MFASFRGEGQQCVPSLKMQPVTFFHKENSSRMYLNNFECFDTARSFF